MEKIAGLEYLRGVADSLIAAGKKIAGIVGLPDPSSKEISAHTVYIKYGQQLSNGAQDLIYKKTFSSIIEDFVKGFDNKDLNAEVYRIVIASYFIANAEDPAFIDEFAVLQKRLRLSGRALYKEISEFVSSAYFMESSASTDDLNGHLVKTHCGLYRNSIIKNDSDLFLSLVGENIYTASGSIPLKKITYEFVKDFDKFIKEENFLMIMLIAINYQDDPGLRKKCIDILIDKRKWFEVSVVRRASHGQEARHYAASCLGKNINAVDDADALSIIVAFGRDLKTRICAAEKLHKMGRKDLLKKAVLMYGESAYKDDILGQRICELLAK